MFLFGVCCGVLWPPKQSKLQFLFIKTSVAEKKKSLSGWKHPSLSRTKWPGFHFPVGGHRLHPSKKRSMFWVQEFPRFFVPKHVSAFPDPEEAMEKIQRDKFQRSEVTRKGGGLPSLKLAASLPLKIGLNAPKGNEKVFQPSVFRDVPVSFREGYLEDQLMTCKYPYPKDRVKWLGLLPQSLPKWFSKQKYVPMKKTISRYVRYDILGCPPSQQ